MSGFIVYQDEEGMVTEPAPFGVGVVRATSSLSVSVWKQRTQARSILLSRPPTPGSKTSPNRTKRRKRKVFKHEAVDSISYSDHAQPLSAP